jgi:hypothetical protein
VKRTGRLTDALAERAGHEQDVEVFRIRRLNDAIRIAGRLVRQPPQPAITGEVVRSCQSLFAQYRTEPRAKAWAPVADRGRTFDGLDLYRGQEMLTSARRGGAAADRE